LLKVKLLKWIILILILIQMKIIADDYTCLYLTY
jgi:hypothetical protein